MRVWAIVAGVLMATPIYGQVNIEDRRLERRESGLSGSVNLAVKLERGNSDLTEITLKPRLVLRAGRNRWFMLNDYSLVETDRVRVINEGFSHLRYNVDVSTRVSVEALTQFQYDREQDLRLRWLLGGGLRFELVQQERASLAVGLTGLFEYEELVTSEVIRTARNSDYVALRVKARDGLTLRNTLYVQPALADLGDIRILDDLELSAAVASWLAVTLGVQYRYDAEPPQGIREYDVSLTNGLTVVF